MVKPTALMHVDLKEISGNFHMYRRTEWDEMIRNVNALSVAARTTRAEVHWVLYILGAEHACIPYNPETAKRLWHGCSPEKGDFCFIKGDSDAFETKQSRRRFRDIRRLIITGVDATDCVLATAWGARQLACPEIIVASDAVQAMKDVHLQGALQRIADLPRISLMATSRIIQLLEDESERRE